MTSAAMPTQPSALLQFLRVEPNEGRPLLLLWIHSLFVGIAIVLLYVAGAKTGFFVTGARDLARI
ncbi:MAG: hypothetical protein VX656_04515 [Candidatus Latescibacterota bacterium]|nr:hypothetical protein [Candidatus Latescibacterota bacterium]